MLQPGFKPTTGSVTHGAIHDKAKYCFQVMINQNLVVILRQHLLIHSSKLLPFFCHKHLSEIHAIICFVCLFCQVLRPINIFGHFKTVVLLIQLPLTVYLPNQYLLTLSMEPTSSPMTTGGNSLPSFQKGYDLPLPGIEPGAPGIAV